MQTCIQSILIIEHQFPAVLATLVQSYDPTQLLLDGIYLRHLFYRDKRQNECCVLNVETDDLIEFVEEYAFMCSQLHRILRDIVKTETSDEVTLECLDPDTAEVRINRITIEVGESQEEQLIQYVNKALDYCKLTKTIDPPVCEYSLTYRFQLGRIYYPLTLVGPVTIKSLYTFVKNLCRLNSEKDDLLRSIEIDDSTGTLQLEFGPRKSSRTKEDQYSSPNIFERERDHSFRVIFASDKFDESSNSKQENSKDSDDSSSNSDSSDEEYEDHDKDSINSKSDEDCEVSITFAKNGYVQSV